MTDASDAVGPSEGITAADLRRRRRRVLLVMTVAVIVLGAAVAVVVEQTWLSRPDLAVGSRHHATMQVEHPCGPDSVVLRQVSYGGHVWWVDGSPTPPLPDGAMGTLVITRPVTNGIGSSPTLDAAEFDWGRHDYGLDGGGESGPLFSCPIQ